MTHKGVFCDTSFFIRLMDKSDPLHANAKGYFRYFMEKNFKLIVSTIAIAEYCVGGDIQQLPLKNLQIISFNLNHARRTSEFAKISFQAKKSNRLGIKERNIIPNDTKLFAQADCENTIEYYLSSDKESRKVYDLLKEETMVKYQFVDINIPYHEIFGVLGLDNDDDDMF